MKQPNSSSPPHRNWEIAAAFSFGVIFLATVLALVVIIPSPTELQIFVFRLVLALAAGGVGAVLPGFIVVRATPYARAGGALALFVMVYSFNPPGIIESRSFENYMQRADRAAAAGNSEAALDFYATAGQINPKRWEPIYGRGRVEFDHGSYAQAALDFSDAFVRQGKTDGSIAYSTSMAQEGLEQYSEEENSLMSARKLLSPDSSLSREVTFDLGRLNLIMWMKTNAPRDSPRYRNAETAFRAHLEHPGSPKQWAHYHLGCLRAIRAEDTSLTAVEATSLRTQANAEILQAVEELAHYADRKAPAQKQMMRDLLRAPEKWSSRPGDPVACPALIRSWISMSGHSIETLIAKL